NPPITDTSTLSLHDALPIFIHTNTVEGFYSIFKRGMKGVYQHCKEKHLHRYLAEFDFRYSYRIRLGYDDAMRAELVAAGIKGKRSEEHTSELQSLRHLVCRL